ncbi:response regulator [Methylobacterium sp. DB0501]|uniref:ATP-binding protein n=1 Tax=Methylobacterium sp. DB0501 TaxID=2709665 RepID=UPI0013ED7B09|nr:ATP-binding protein [Methylobacterium sp. DB0501]NGM37807.1 response regulator [Methylobacterium sp. DB0501]
MNLKRSYRSLVGGVWAGVVTTCLGLATVTVWTDTRDYERTIRDARSTAEAVVQALGQEANRLVSSVDMLLSAAAARVDAHTFGASQAYTRQLLSGLMAHIPAVMAVRVLDGTTAGVLFGQGGAGAEGRSTDAGLIRAALAMGQSELAIGSPTRVGPADTWFVSVARMVTPRPGETPLVAVADLSLTELQRLYGQLDLGANGAIGLLRSDGVVLVRHPYVPDKVGSSVAGGSLMRAAAGAAGGTFDGSASPIDGVPRYGSFQRVAGAPLLVTTGLSKDETLAAWRDGVRQDAAIVLGISAVLVGLGFGLTRALTRHRDLEEARRAAGMLSAGEARYRLLAENTSELIVLAHDDGRRSYVSPAVRRLLGYMPEEAAAMRLRDCVHREDLALLVTQARRLAAGETQVSVVCRARHRSGSWVWVEGAFRRIPGAAPGEPAIIATFRDVGERQRHARALEEARITAERASQAKTDFLASMSHEIRTPLNGVIGYADLLLADRTLPGRHRRYVDRIAAAGGALLTVVDDILDFSRIEAGGIALAEVPFAPAALIDNAASIVRGLSEPKGLALDVALDATVPDWVRGDPDRLRQILLNLLNNAVKFTPAGRVAVRVEAEGGTLRFSVSDTGIGIAPEQHGRLFQRFSQVDGSIRRQYGGSGLGLAICKGLVDLMGGTIGVESRPGAGSTFWFRVRLPACPAPAAEEAAGRPEPVRPARLLLVEDVPINQDLARAVLEADGHSVDVAGDGAAAIEAVRAKPYDLVLMDVQMPGMDGITATRAIRALPEPVGTVPIVAMTANVLPAQLETFRAAGMDGHVGKPFKRAELAAAIARHRADGGGPVPVPVLVDAEAFAEARTLMGPERIDALLGLLAAELEQRFRARSGDRAGLAHDAHAMISAAGLLGFTGLSDLCREIEEACRAGADLPDLQCRIEAARAAALAQIETLRAA